MSVVTDRAIGNSSGNWDAIEIKPLLLGGIIEGEGHVIPPRQHRRKWDADRASAAIDVTYSALEIAVFQPDLVRVGRAAAHWLRENQLHTACGEESHPGFQSYRRRPQRRRIWSADGLVNAI